MVDQRANGGPLALRQTEYFAWNQIAAISDQAAIITARTRLLVILTPLELSISGSLGLAILEMSCAFQANCCWITRNEQPLNGNSLCVIRAWGAAQAET
jgi:hypothetical protein